jgi:PIN domain nuclease of toxin-antitoxin system
VATFVADTHAFVWFLTAPNRLGKGARRLLAAADEGRSLCLVPAIALVEIALLKQRGRVAMGVDVVLRAIEGHPGCAVLALDAAQAIEFSALVGVKDPMDRLVLAAAGATRCRLVSADEALDGHGVDRVWD